jgi:hypothetical protein
LVLRCRTDSWIGPLTPGTERAGRCATGDVIVVRYADDTIVGFQHRADAERFLYDLTERLALVCTRSAP